MSFDFGLRKGIGPHMRRQRILKTAIFAAVLPCFLVSSAPSHAQAAPQSGQLLQTVPQQQAPLPRRDLQLEYRLRDSKSLTDVEGMLIEVKGFRLTGLSLIPEAQVQKALQPFVGANRNFQTLIDAAAKVKEILAQHGYFLANAIIPEQRIYEGVIEILVLEGKLGKVKIEYEEGVRINRSLVESYAAQLKPGSFVSAASVERALFLISDLRGIQVQSMFEPGETVGTSDLNIKISRGKTVDANLDLDANGSIYTGIVRGSAGVDLSNPFARGDLLSLRYTSALENVHPSPLQYARLSYLAPIGSRGTKIGASVADLKYKLGTPIFEPLKASGSAEVQSLIGIHPLVRSRNANLLGTYQYDFRRFHDYQDTTRRTTDKSTSLSAFGLSGDLRDPLLGGGINVFNASYTTGRLAFATDVLRAADEAGHFTAGDYHKSNFTYSRLQSVTARTAVYFSYSAQYANKNLDPSEKISLGGPAAVRAYPQGEGAGDEGYFGTIEARHRLITPEKLPGIMVLTFFHDFGGSLLNKSPLEADTINRRRIAGLGFGLNWEVPGNWALRTSLAFPLTAHALSEHVPRDPHMYLLLSKYF